MFGSVLCYISHEEEMRRMRDNGLKRPVLKLVKLVHLPFAFQISCLTEIYDFLWLLWNM